MTYEKPKDPSAARVEGTDFAGVRLHGPDFEGTVVTDGWFINADFSGDVEGLVINGVEVAPLIEAELDRRTPGESYFVRPNQKISEMPGRWSRACGR